MLNAPCRGRGHCKTPVPRPPAVKTPAVIATAVAVGLERSRVVKPPFLRTRSALIFVPRSRLNAAPDSPAASSTIEPQLRGVQVFFRNPFPKNQTPCVPPPLPNAP